MSRLVTQLWQHVGKPATPTIEGFVNSALNTNSKISRNDMEEDDNDQSHETKRERNKTGSSAATRRTAARRAAKKTATTRQRNAAAKHERASRRRGVESASDSSSNNARSLNGRRRRGGGGDTVEISDDDDEEEDDDELATSPDHNDEESMDDDIIEVVDRSRYHDDDDDDDDDDDEDFASRLDDSNETGQLTETERNASDMSSQNDLDGDDDDDDDDDEDDDDDDEEDDDTSRRPTRSGTRALRRRAPAAGRVRQKRPLASSEEDDDDDDDEDDESKNVDNRRSSSAAQRLQRMLALRSQPRSTSGHGSESEDRAANATTYQRSTKRRRSASESRDAAHAGASPTTTTTTTTAGAAASTASNTETKGSASGGKNKDSSSSTAATTDTATTTTTGATTTKQATSSDRRLRRRGGGGGAATLDGQGGSTPLAARVEHVPAAIVDQRVYNLDMSEIDMSSRVHLSRGAVSDVYKVRWRGASAVLKEWHSSAQDDRFKNEVDIMRMCQFPRVVQLYGASLKHKVVLMERIGRGNLRQVLTSEKYTLAAIDRRMRGWAIEVAEAMAFVHANNIIHYDLKSQNVLVNMAWHVRLCDFSHSLYVRHDGAPQWGQVGSLEITAPEVFATRARTKASDIYSYALLLWEMLSHGEPPYMQYATDAAALRVFVLPPVSGRPPLKSAWPAEWKALIRKSWQVDPADRGTFRSILEAFQFIPDVRRK